MLPIEHKRKGKDVEKGLLLAIKAVGSRYRLAKALNLTPAAVQKWWRIPAERVVDVERATGVDHPRALAKDA